MACLAKWTSGETGTLHCNATGPSKDAVKVDKETFRLGMICVNDARIASYAFDGGQTAPLTTTVKGNARCADFDGLKRLPESCTCVPPAGGDCTPPKDGFVCLAVGWVPLPGL